MTLEATPSFADEVSRELGGEPHHRRFRPGFERRLAARIAARLAASPAELERDLRVALALEAELAADPACAEAHRQWSAFVELLASRWSRARGRAARAASAYQARARGAVDSGLRAAPAKAQSTDVPAGPLARFALASRVTKTRGGER